MANANFTVEGASVPPEYAGSYSQTIDLALVSTSGVRTVAWSVVGKSRNAAVNPTITPAGSPLGATASFNMGASPGGTLGVSFLIQCVVNGGTDDEGIEDSNLTKRAVVGVANGAGIVPVAFGETLERDAALGYTEEFNSALNAAGGGGTLSAPADPGDDGKVAIASGGDLTYALLANANVDASAAIAHTKLANIATDSVLGRDTAGTGALEAITLVLPLQFSGSQSIRIQPGTQPEQILKYNGSAWVAGALDLTSSEAVSGLLPASQFANGSACSIFGRSANSSGVQASIAAGTNGFVFCRRSNVVTAALLLNENIDNSAAIAHSKLANITQGRVLGRADATGAPQELVAQNGVATNGTDDSLVLVDETTTGGILINLGKTASTWRAIGPTSTRFNADAAADFSTASPATVRGIITNSSLLADRDIDITPADYHTGTILNVIYLHNSGVAFGYQFDVVGGTLNPTGAIAEPDGVDLADWLTDSKITASCSLDFQVRYVTGTEDNEKELVFLGGQLLLQTSTAGF